MSDWTLSVDAQAIYDSDEENNSDLKHWVLPEYHLRSACRGSVATARTGFNMICNHLKPVEDIIKSEGVPETFRGSPWGKVKGVWVYFECYLLPDKLIESLALQDCVKMHEHKGTHDGSELGLVCETCDCGIMGLHPLFKKEGIKSIG